MQKAKTSKKNKKDELREIHALFGKLPKEKKAAFNKMLASSYGAASKQAKAERIDDQPYGPLTAVNNRLPKFSLSHVKAALLAWSHTVSFPRTPTPYPLPIMAVSGVSAAPAKMYQVPLKGTATANAAGFVCIALVCDTWMPVTVSNGAGVLPTPACQLVANSPTAGNGCAVWMTQQAYVGQGGAYGPLSAPAASSLCDGTQTGVTGVRLPKGFMPEINAELKYNLVSAELRARPEGKLLDQSGDLNIFNYRATPNLFLQLDQGGGDTTAIQLAMLSKYVPRSRRATAQWPNDKWLTAVANPNTSTCFGQWSPITTPLYSCFAPSVFLLGKGLDPGTPIEWEATFNYALYGSVSFAAQQAQETTVSVGGEQANSVVANGLNKMLEPTIAHESKVSNTGVKAFARAEQASTGLSTADIMSGIKAGKDVVEAVTGTDLGETLAEVAATVFGALL